MTTMRQEFKAWLINVQHLPEFSPSGSRSTGSDYPWRIAQICKSRSMCWETLSDNIGSIILEYDHFGDMRDTGKRSHESVINALRYFKSFVGEQPKKTNSPNSAQKRRWWSRA